MSEANAQVVQRLFTEVWAGGNSDVLEEIIDSSYRSHIDEASVVRMSRWTGPGILRVELAAYRSGIPDLQIEVSKLIGEGDVVAALFELSGTNTGQLVIEPLQGSRDEELAGSGKTVRASGAAFFTLSDGKVTQADISWSSLGPIDQIRFFARGSLDLRVGEVDATLKAAG